MCRVGLWPFEGSLFGGGLERVAFLVIPMCKWLSHLTFTKRGMF